MAYVPQSDVLIPSLTVQECIRYSALLRLPADTQPLDLQVRPRLGRARAEPRWLAGFAVSRLVYLSGLFSLDSRAS